MFEEICIILLLNFVFYLKTIGFNYCSDDIPSSQRGKNKNKLKHWFLVLEGHEKSNPQTDHAITTLIHSLVCVGIYLGFGKNDISFLAALLFAFNPTNNQGSVWISGRGYALSALGMTWAMALPVLSPILIFLATYSNAGFFMPIALLGSSSPWMFLFAIGSWSLHWKNFSSNVKAKMKHEMLVEDRAVKPEKLILAIKTFGFYTTLSIFPFKNTFYHSFLQSASGCGAKKAYSINDRFFWIGLVLVLSILYYWITVPWNMVSFGLLWWCVSLAPFCNLMRMSQEIAERYTYAAACGLMYVLASVIISNPVFVAAFLAMYATKMYFLMDQYQDEYYLLEHACVNDPSAWFAWHIRGLKRWDNQSYQEAVIIWTMARMLSPNEFKVNFNLSTALAMSGHKKEAEKFLEIAEKCIPRGQEEQINKLLSDWRKGNMAILT